MVSDASKKKAAAKKAAAAVKRGSKSATAATSSKAASTEVSQNGHAERAADQLAELQISDLTCTGVLTSHALSRDIHIESLSVTFDGHELIVDSELKLNYGRHYGLLGLNGCGKSTLLTAMGCWEIPIPDHMNIHHLTREIEANHITIVEAVINDDEEKLKFEKEAKALTAQDDGGGANVHSQTPATSRQLEDSTLFSLKFCDFVWREGVLGN